MYISRNHLSADIYFAYKINIYPDIWLHIQVDIKNERKRNIPMFEQNINSCVMLKKMNKKVKGFLFSWLRKFWSVSNFPQSCPVKKVSSNFC